MIASDAQRARLFNEEVTRHQCPVHGVARRTTREVSIHESDIPAGDWVWLIYASACRDERVYQTPLSFVSTEMAHLILRLAVESIIASVHPSLVSSERSCSRSSVRVFRHIRTGPDVSSCTTIACLAR